MAISKISGAFCGTDETTLQAITNGALQTGAEVDVLGDDVSVGDIEIYAVVTSTVTAGTIDVTVNKRRVSAQAYIPRGTTAKISPINGTQKLYLGMMRATRYMSADVQNNATGASASVSILYVGKKLT